MKGHGILIIRKDSKSVNVCQKRMNIEEEEDDDDDDEEEKEEK